MQVEDLDVLRPEPKFVRLNGKDIDVSFIPCGITFEVDTLIREMGIIGMDALEKGGPEAKRAFDLSVELCSVFCSRKYPELNKEWFNENVDGKQLQMFALAIRDALVRAYSGVSTDSKNVEATKETE